MDESFKKFITELKEMFDAKENFCITVEDPLGNYIEFSELAETLISKANSYLISSDGEVNYKNKKILEDNGFKIYPGETDSFGWLTGIIERNNRKLIFG